MNIMQSTKCPRCSIFDSWEHIGFLCLACQFANMTFQNPFIKRYEILLNTWLPLQTDVMSSTETSDQESIDEARYNTEMYTTPNLEHSTLLRLRRQSIDDSLSTIRSRSSLEQNHVIFEDLIELKKNLMENTNTDDSKQNSQDSQNSSRQTKFKNLNHNNEDCHTQDMETNLRGPLKDIDQNSTIDRKYRWPVGSKNRIKNKIEQCKRKKHVITVQKHSSIAYLNAPIGPLALLMPE